MGLVGQGVVSGMRASINTSKRIQIGLLIALLGMAILVVSWIHDQFFPVRVVLYDAILDVLVGSILILALYLAWLRNWLILTPDETMLALLVGILLGLFYALSVPTLIDRSLSVYILEKIQQRGGGIQQDAVERMIMNEYLREHQVADVRLTEQLNSGTIEIKDGCVMLTDRGRLIVAFTQFYRTHLLPKRREIMGKLTDDLTDPFRRSPKSVDYTCEKGDHRSH